MNIEFRYTPDGDKIPVGFNYNIDGDLVKRDDKGFTTYDIHTKKFTRLDYFDLDADISPLDYL